MDEQTEPNPAAPYQGENGCRPAPALPLNVRRNFFQRIKDRLWGYDFFISYQWSSGGEYAVNLAQRLRDKHYDVFLDRWDYAASDDWKVLGQIALRNTQRLVLIATKGAVTESKPVEREVEIFTNRGRHVIPIVFGEELKSLDRTQYPTLGRLPESKLYVAEDPTNHSTAPSDETVDRLIQTHGVLRRRNLRAIITAIPAILVILFAANATYQATVARTEKENAVEAKNGETSQRKRAEREQEKAEKQQAEANRENANFYWQFAIDARDAKEPLKAAHLFLRAGKSLGLIVPEHTTPADRSGMAADGLAASTLDRHLVRIWRHDSEVLGALFSHNESRVLTWSRDLVPNGEIILSGETRLWDITKAEPILTFKHAGEVRGAQFSVDDFRVLTWSSDDVKLWDVSKAEPTRTFDHSSPDGAQFSRDKSRVLTWSNSEVKLWDVDKRNPIQIFKNDFSMRDQQFRLAGSGAQFSKDELRVLSWSDSGAGLWDIRKTEPIQIFERDNYVSGAQFSHDESHVLTWSNNVKLWDANKTEPIQTFKHDNGVNSIQFSRDKSRMLTCDDKTALLWDVSKPEPIQTFRHEFCVNGAQFSEDESRVLTWSSSEVRLWNVTQLQPIQIFNHDRKVLSARFSQDKSRVLTWSENNIVRLWEETRSQPIQTFKHDSEIRGAQFSRHASRLLTWNRDGGNKGEVRLWDVTKSDPIRIVKTGIHSEDSQFSRDESRVLRWGFDSASLWDLTKEAKLIQTFKQNGFVKGALFNRDESRVLTWSGDLVSNGKFIRKGEAKLWDVNKSEPVRTFKHDREVRGSRFSRDESRMLTWSDDNTTKLWDVTRAEPIRTFQHDDIVYGARFNRDESRVLTWSNDETAKLWDVIQPETVQTFQHDYAVRGAQFSRDELHVLTWSGNALFKRGDVRLWDVNEIEQVRILNCDGEVRGAQFNRNESHVLTWSNNEIMLWEVTKPEPSKIFEHNGEVLVAKFSQNESRVLAWSNNEVSLWGVTKSEPIQIFKHFSKVLGAQFSGDEFRVLTWSDDTRYQRNSCEIRLWDVTKADPIHTFSHDGVFRGAQFSHDDSLALSWASDKVWFWDLADPLAALSPAERILELEVRSGTTLDEQQNLRTLKFDEWQAKAKSPEYREIELKLAARPARSAARTDATSDKLARESAQADVGDTQSRSSDAYVRMDYRPDVGVRPTNSGAEDIQVSDKDSDSQSAVASNAAHQPTRQAEPPRPTTNTSPNAKLGPVASNTKWSSFALLGYAGLIVLMVLLSKSRGQSQTKNEA